MRCAREKKNEGKGSLGNASSHTATPKTLCLSFHCCAPCCRLFLQRVIIYPAYIDSKKTVAGGRRIPAGKGVRVGCFSWCACVAPALCVPSCAHVHTCMCARTSIAAAALRGSAAPLSRPIIIIQLPCCPTTHNRNNSVRGTQRDGDRRRVQVPQARRRARGAYVCVWNARLVVVG